MQCVLFASVVVTALQVMAPEALDIPFEPISPPSAQSEALIEINPEEDFWKIVNERRIPADLERYLKAYPNGVYRAKAEARIASAEAERKLKLPFRTRREVQELLLLLGHAPNGRDGVLGSGSRAAIAAWQKSGEREDTGYLTQQDLDQLRADGAAHAKEILDASAGALREKAQQRREDWRTLKIDELFTPLADYVEKHPFGRRSEAALAALSVLADVEARDAGDATLETWRAAQAEGSVDGWQAFRDQTEIAPLAKFARAELARLAAQQILRDPPGGESGNYARGTLAWAEQLLVAGGYGQMTADGSMTDKTRAAIASFQRGHALEVTGALDAKTMSLLIAESRR